MSPSLRTFMESIAIGVGLTGFTYIVGIMAGWIPIDVVNWLEVLAVFTSYSCTYMCVRQSRWNYPIGILTTFLYSWFFWTAAPEPAKAMAVFNLYLVGSLTFGYFRWGPDGNPRRVSRVESKYVPAYLGVTAAVALLLYVATLFGAKIGLLEASIVVVSALAQFLLDNKKIETWAVWAVVNVASIYFYYEQGWYLVMFQYVFFLMNTIWGFVAWAESKRQDEAHAYEAIIDDGINKLLKNDPNIVSQYTAAPEVMQNWLITELLKMNPLLDPSRMRDRIVFRMGATV